MTYSILISFTCRPITKLMNWSEEQDVALWNAVVNSKTYYWEDYVTKSLNRTEKDVYTRLKYLIWVKIEAGETSLIDACMLTGLRFNAILAFKDKYDEMIGVAWETFPKTVDSTDTSIDKLQKKVTKLEENVTELQKLVVKLLHDQQENKVSGLFY